jgi:alkylglycerol monooxygenase
MHHSMGLLYQFWIHTELVDGLGDFLNYFLNVPKHHQVHHGRNPYCIDKNYGACLIIWDRMFGTFADRDADTDYEGEKIAYGLIPPVNSFGYLKVQFHSLRKVQFTEITGYQFFKLIRRFFRTKGFSNKMKVLFYGPGWNPQGRSSKITFEVNIKSKI